MKAILVALSALQLLSPANAQESPFLPGAVEVAGRQYLHRLLPPARTVEGERYPLVLFLHGVGERGSDNRAQLRHLPERMVQDEYREHFPCFVLAPQCPEDDVWSTGGRGMAQGGPLRPASTRAMQAAIAALEEVVREHPIDTDRIYLTGLSMGGAGVWDLATRHPEWFAAAAPVCGGGDAAQGARLAGLPLSVWQGADDTLIESGRSLEMAEAVRAAGGALEYHELEGVGHDSWEKAYELGGAIDWMFERRRDTKDDLSAAQRALVTAVDEAERIAFLGDSITQAGNDPGGYVDSLRVALGAGRPEAKVIPAGISGHKVPDLLRRYRADVIEPGATMVFLYIGINDVWHSESGRGTSEADFEAGLRTLVRDFRGTGAEVVLATPSVIGERPAGENRLDEMLARYAAISRRVAREEGAVLCDLARAFRDHLRVFNGANAERGVLTTDGVHLNEAGNRLLATEAARALTRAANARRERRDPNRRTLRVFLLAGQSNMEGKGAVNTLEHLGDDPALGYLLKDLRTEEGEWRVRDDVWVSFLERSGALTTGFGSPGGQHGPLIGPELGFGWVVGDHFEDPVLLVKAAWGGKDLAGDFRPPSEGGPGKYYKRMVSTARFALDCATDIFPDSGATEVELAGVVWFQGWNDMVDEEKTAAYAKNLASLIRDLREEFDRPLLPFVIGELGVGGPEPGAGVARFRAAQAEVAADPVLGHRVRLVRTSGLYDMQAHALYEADVWKGPDKERYYRIASDRPYHYLGSGKVYYLMGRAFGEAMIELLEQD